MAFCYSLRAGSRGQGYEDGGLGRKAKESHPPLRDLPAAQKEDPSVQHGHQYRGPRVTLDGVGASPPPAPGSGDSVSSSAKRAMTAAPGRFEGEDHRQGGAWHTAPSSAWPRASPAETEPSLTPPRKRRRLPLRAGGALAIWPAPLTASLYTVLKQLGSHSTQPNQVPN